ncbi:hypothetical protein [Schlesneria sp. DSM 10557]|uniref:hypothetical protein n=1 Tax=Schlesneria sp. DSM 10557 TaxID=3044399 RepID=UPI0035A1A4B4
MVVYGLTAVWIFAVVCVICCWPAECLIGFGVVMGANLAWDAAETRQFRLW